MGRKKNAESFLIFPCGVANRDSQLAYGRSTKISHSPTIRLRRKTPDGSCPAIAFEFYPNLPSGSSTRNNTSSINPGARPAARWTFFWFRFWDGLPNRVSSVANDAEKLCWARVELNLNGSEQNSRGNVARYFASIAPPPFIEETTR